VGPPLLVRRPPAARSAPRPASRPERSGPGRSLALARRRAAPRFGPLAGARREARAGLAALSTGGPRAIASLSVWKFASAAGASDALQAFEALERKGAIVLEDAAVVSWPKARAEPTTREFHHLQGRAQERAVWRLLFRTFFGIHDRVVGIWRDLGIRDEAIAAARAQLEPGTSALLILSAGADLRELAPTFRGGQVELLRTTLSDKRERRLRRALGLG
jgi:uncharacterized membrane protein